MKKNKLLLIAIAGAALFAVYWLLFKKGDDAAASEASGTDPLLDALTSSFSGGSSSAPIAATTTTPATTAPATAPAPTWKKVTKGDTTNTWLSSATGQYQTLQKGHNPNKADTLTVGDRKALATESNEEVWFSVKETDAGYEEQSTFGGARFTPKKPASETTTT